MDNGLLMNKMSSGERQMLQSASYMLYHIKNIESIREDNNRKAYRHINIVLDEAELYYHPEMQRTMIANIIKMLSWCHINNTKIRSVHIMLVTHSPFVLSDVPKNRILYMKDGNTAKKTIKHLQQIFMICCIISFSLRIQLVKWHILLLRRL